MVVKLIIALVAFAIGRLTGKHSDDDHCNYQDNYEGKESGGMDIFN